MGDAALRKDILDELEFEPSVNAANIGVIVHDGVVTLTGHVSSYAEKLAAEAAVRRIKGVRAIAQEIEVRYPNAKRSADDQIAERALNIIAWDTTIPENAVMVKVQHGVVTLSGAVDWHFQKEAAETAVRKLSGVLGVSNLITVKPQANVADVKTKIEDALRRDAQIEAQAISVSVHGSQVTLEGVVHDWREHDAVKRAAWSAQGVTAVDDRLTIA